MYPWRTTPSLARRLDAVARKHGVAVLGTGVNGDIATCAIVINAIQQVMKAVPGPV